jgi:hypothetical protein
MKLQESHGQAPPNAPPQFRPWRESILAVKTSGRLNAGLSQEKSLSSPPQNSLWVAPKSRASSIYKRVIAARLGKVRGCHVEDSIKADEILVYWSEVL